MMQHQDPLVKVEERLIKSERKLSELSLVAEREKKYLSKKRWHSSDHKKEEEKVEPQEDLKVTLNAQELDLLLSKLNSQQRQAVRY